MSRKFLRILNSPDTSRCFQGIVVVAQELLRSQGITKGVNQHVKNIDDGVKAIAAQLVKSQELSETLNSDQDVIKDSSLESATKRQEKTHNNFKAIVGESERAMMLEVQRKYQDTTENKDRERWQQKQKKVPDSPLARVAGFGSLAVGLVGGGVAEAVKRIGGASEQVSGPVFISENNSERLAKTLCRMRGAALKIGQMMSIQDESLMPPHLAQALEKVRQNADVMPVSQLNRMLKDELGSEWETRFSEFDKIPFAAASLGQVHRAKIVVDKHLKPREIDVAVKIQFPGVAESIDSDLANLKLLADVTGIFPKGIFINNIISVMKDELKEECDYELEAEHQMKFRRMIASETVGDVLQFDNFYVPSVIPELSTKRILTTEWATGVPIDRVADFPASVRNSVGRRLLKLSLLELFHFRYMQTDPNYSNFLYDVTNDRITLIDFGATRSYDKDFVSTYLKLVWAASNSDRAEVLEVSKRLGFLTGEESQKMIDAHIEAGLEVGRPFQRDAPFDFKGSKISNQMSRHGDTFAYERLTPPPREIYSLHRKLSGAYMTCIKIGAIFPCRDLLVETVKSLKPELLLKSHM
uniref:ABC1 atypical kinase-like domain-containing protein n=1 Tax=Aplanochytrium stocchinoi TaxID=215587 RepID=A0A7S3V0L6_9STRA|mmetsp:Transcript_194/g.307  ORF Transcript_194/g.307 Transcript_194/m.307 type:complete len:584 (+) Transcript_194:225-1976(+)|eukprot:CAMPEP_0204844064 /NCGR_PEP_ID=MMETSP1346-20131115/48342_1 /ASSEMBLY_ACC=CAM_ASM_000771 /TAXON_ID=215587 /ORGANISM="Aplanochytrium stocchinoi, Strain GSBS06" /LENGTH=583 /DNA_ID=CAMNT_0051983309 /DNA_START=163 /DNA_END=1914 /DNA_ORIENTATION=+